MTQEEKELLFKDICARLPYVLYFKMEVDGKSTNKILTTEWISDIKYHPQYYKAYLRPLSSMTTEEKEELLNLLFDKESKNFYIDEEGFIDGKTSDLMKDGLNYPSFCPINIVLYTDWLDAHHFDYRGLIEKGLALAAPEGMYEVQD